MVTRNVTIRMTDEELKLLDKIANQLNLTRSDAVRKLLSDFKGAVAEAVKGRVSEWRRETIRDCLETIFYMPGRLRAFEDVINGPFKGRDMLLMIIWRGNNPLIITENSELGKQLLVKARELLIIKEKGLPAAALKRGQARAGDGRAAQVAGSVGGGGAQLQSSAGNQPPPKPATVPPPSSPVLTINTPEGPITIDCNQAPLFCTRGGIRRGG